MNNLPKQPYKGLEPYQEQDQDNFFGREADKWILVDKILTHKLTFLFAASGVGKSSLLQAAVIPELKQPSTASRKPLDVLYHREWLESPIETLKQAILTALRKEKRIASNYTLRENLPLTEFLQFCTAFTSDPWVIILDQFEEFFNNLRYHKEFPRFIEELATAIHDQQTPTVFVIAMREDFAMELDEFKGSISNFLIDNFYRLKNLTFDKATEVLEKPLQRFSFAYEPGLVRQIVEALGKRELIERHGKEAGEWDLEIPLLVEPPTLQIVCTQLWEADRQNPNRLITLATYQRKGGSLGWLKVFFEEKMKQFDYGETKLASGAFNQLVSKYSTKVPRQLEVLAKDLRVAVPKLEKTLDKLDQARVLRKHFRQKAIWYELYHDAFSGIVYDWNEAYKNRQRVWKAGQVVVAMVVAYGGYEFWLNATHYHFRLNVKSGVSDTVEVYQGQDGSRDWFGQQHYLGETSYTRSEIEADKLFEARNMGDLNRFAVELIKDFPLEQRITDYWEAGATETALKTANQLLVTQPDLISTLAGFHTASGLELLATHLSTSEEELKSKIITTLGESQSPWQAIPLLRPLVAKESRDFQKQLVEAFKKLGSPLAVAPLVELLKDNDSDVQAVAAEALGELGEPQPSVFEALIGVLNTSQKEEEVRLSVLNALAQFKDPQVIPALVPLLNGAEEEVQKQATLTLGELGSTEAVPYLVKLLQDGDENTRQQVVTLLTKFGQAVPIPALVDLLKTQESDIRGSVVELLKNLKSNETVPLLLALLKDAERRVRQNGVAALGQLATPEAITSLLTLLQEVRPEVRGNAVEALGQLTSTLYEGRYENINFDTFQQMFSHNQLRLITTLLKDPDAKVRSQAVKTLGQVGSVEEVTEPWIESEIVLPLLSLVADPEASVRESTASVLGQLGPSKAVKASVKQEISKALLGLLKDKEAYVRSSAAEALGNLGDKNEEVVEALIGLLEDRYEEVRGKVVEALGEVGNEKAIGPLYNYWRESSDEDDSATVLALASVLAGAENLERAEFIRLVSAVVVNPYFGYHIDYPVIIALANKLGELGGEDSAKALLQILNQLLNMSNDTASVGVIEVLGQFFGVKAIKPLVKLLEKYDSSDPVTTSVTTVLGRTSSAQVVQPLVDLLSSENQNTLVSATLSLGQLANIEAIKPLVETEAMKPLTRLLTHQSYKVRRSAGWTLSQLDGQKNVGLLVDMLTDKDLDDRFGAMGALNQWESVEALPTLLKEVDLSYSSDDHFSLSAVNALYSLDSTLTMRTLVENLAFWGSMDGSSSQFSDVTGALGHLGDTEALNSLELRLLNHDDSFVRRGAAEALGKLGSAEATPALLNLLKEENEEWVYEAAIDALDNLNSPDLEELLLTWLTDSLSTKRAYAAEKLGTLGTVKAVPPLTALLQDPVSTVRGSAVEALSQLKVTEAIPLLTPLLDDPFSSVRESAVQALSQLNHLESVPRFIALLKDPYPAVRQSAAQALGELKSTQAFPALIELLQDPEAEVLEDAILALGQLGQAEAAQHLLPLLKDKRASIRRSVAQALGELGTLEAVPLLEGLLTDYRDIDVRQSAAAALVQLEPAKAEERLKQLLKDPDSQMIQYALAEWDALDSLQTVRPLVELLLYPDTPYSNPFPEETMYGQVTTALANLGLLKPDAARQAHQLQRLHTQATRLNPQQREAAATELGQIVSPHSVELLLTLLKDNHLAVKHQVLLSLKRLGELHPHLILPARPALQALTSEDPKTTSLVQKVLQKIEAVTPQTPNTNLAIEQLKQIALNPQERLTTRSSAIKLLGKLGTADVADTLMTVAKDLMKEVKTEVSQPTTKPSVAPLLLFATYRALGNTTASETTLSFLDSQLQQLADYKQTWRDKGRNKRWNYSQSELELGYAIARLNQNRGIELLSHDLAQIRTGAELALGRSLNLELLRNLTQLRSSNPPAGLYDAFFQQASLQTIDNLLTTLADKGGAKELTALEKWLPNVPDAAVKERVAWMVEKLKIQVGNK